MTADPSRTYTYTPFNMMETATLNGTVTTYRYDGDNQRVSRAAAAEHVLYYRNGEGQVMSEFERTGSGSAWRRDYIYLGSRLVAAVSIPPLNVSFAAADSSVSEAASSVHIVVRLITPEPLAAPVTVSVTTADGTAGAGLDYQTLSTTATFPAGSIAGATQTVSIALLPDGFFDRTETFLVLLGAPTGGAALGAFSTHTVTIVEDDPAPAEFIYPTPNATVSTSPVFQWTDVPGAEAFTLFVGTIPGGSDLLRSPEILGLQYQAFNLPAGRTLYARIYTRQSGVWLYNDVTFTTAAPSSPDTLFGNQALYPGQWIRSQDGRFTLTYQTDGNLVLFNPNSAPIWSSGTYGTSAGRAIMQTDGNFVVYDASAVAVWHTYTWGKPGAYLVVQNDGNVVLYSASGAVLWQTGTSGGSTPLGRWKCGNGCYWDQYDSGPDQCTPGDSCAPGRWKCGANGCYWDATDSGPNQCNEGDTCQPTGRWKCGGDCYWDPNDSGPDQCNPGDYCGTPTSLAGTADLALLASGQLACIVAGWVLRSRRRRGRLTRNATGTDHA